MATKQLYVLVLPEQNQNNARGQGRRNQQSSGTLGGGTASVQPISQEPGTKRIVGGYGNEYAEKMAAEWEELFQSQGIEEIPWTSKATTSQEDGYYTASDITRTPDVPAERRVQQFDGKITRTGDQSSHYRSIATNVQTVTNPFGSQTTALLGLHTDAERTRWMEPDAGTVEQATSVSTNTGEHGNIDFYNAQNSNFTNPILLYELDYATEWKGDVRVFDDYGRSKTDTIDGTDVPLTWQRVFVVDHNYQGNPIVETQKLRLELDKSANSLTASRWDSGSSSYSSVSLGTSDWQLYDYRFVLIGLERVDMVMEFEDTQTAGNYYRLNASFKRGRENVLFHEQDGASSTPANLQTLLDPIADDSDRDPTGFGGDPAAGVMPKDEVSF